MRKKPTLPSVHILAMHVQQLEIGAFTLTSGAYKWTKLRYCLVAGDNQGYPVPLNGSEK